MQKLCGFTAWLNSASATGMVALSSPGGRGTVSGTPSLRTTLSPSLPMFIPRTAQQGQDDSVLDSGKQTSCPVVARPGGRGAALGGLWPWGDTPRRTESQLLPLTQLLDALLVLDEQLDPGDVNVQPWALGRPLHRGVKASVVLAVGRRAGGGRPAASKRVEGVVQTQRGPRPRGGERKQLCGTHLISISARLFASAKQQRGGLGEDGV